MTGFAVFSGRVLYATLPALRASGLSPRILRGEIVLVLGAVRSTTASTPSQTKPSPPAVARDSITSTSTASLSTSTISERPTAPTE